MSNQEERAGSVYLVYNRATGARYVGKTLLTVKQRWHEHVREALKGRGAHARFYHAIRKYGTRVFSMEELVRISGTASVVKNALSKLERCLIILWKSYVGDYPEFGYNMTRGGEGGDSWDRSGLPNLRWTQERKERAKLTYPRFWKGKRLPTSVKKKISETRKARIAVGLIKPNKVSRPGALNPHYGKKHSAEVRAAMSRAKSGKNNPNYGKPSWNRGKRTPPEVKEKLRQAMLGNKHLLRHKHSAKTRNKMSIAHANISQETRERMRVARTGRKHSAESIARMSVVQMGHKCSEETRAKISTAMQGKKTRLGIKLSDETREKIRIKAKGRKLSKEHKASIGRALLGNKNALGKRGVLIER